MLRKLILLICLLAPHSLPAKQLPQDWVAVGKADLQVLWFDIYQAELSTPDGMFHGLNNPMLLQIIYKRNISRDELLDETRKQIRTFASSEMIPLWIARLEKIWPQIKKGDELIFWIDQEASGHFYYNREWIGSLNDPQFSHAFIQIWLSDRGDYPNLARKLRGEFKDEVTE